MKRLFTIFATFAMLCAVGCEEQGGDDVNPNDKPNTEQPSDKPNDGGNENEQPEDAYISLNKEIITFSPDGESVDVKVYSNYEWTLTNNCDWVTTSISSGEASDAGVVVTLTADLTYDDREGTIKFSCGRANKLLVVSQSFKQAIIADENNVFNVPAEGGVVEVAYQTNVECEVIIPEEAKSWISLAPAETRGLVSESTTLTVAKNTSYSERSAVVKVVKVGDNTLFAEYTINQVRQSDGVFVLCEGTFGAGNSSLWHYYPENKAVTANVFHSANDARLGDMAQSLYMYNGLLFVVVNNSGVVFAIDRTTGKVEGMIDDLLSPRFIAIDGTGTKGYISQMYTNELITFDPRTLERTGSITLEGVAGSEQMEVWGDKLFIASWSNDNKITVLDTDTDQQIATFEVGVQPYSMVLDKNDTLWVVCDGGNEYSTLPEGVTMEAPSLWKISAETNVKTKVFDFKDGGWFSSRLAINGAGDTIYFIYDKRCWAIDVATGKLPTESFITIEGYGLYGIGVDPVSEDIYIADAKDYVSNGEVFRYSPEGELIDTFEVGILPSSFAFFRE